jgi:hypothetical protein
MKFVLSLLVVANLLLYGWFRGWMAPFGGDGREPVRLERQLSPDALRVVPAGAAAAAGAGAPGATASEGAGAAAPGALGGPALLAALRATGCAELGPMSEAEAVRVQVALDAVVADLSVATQRAEDTTSWWVYLAPGPTETSTRIAELRERGVTDTYVMPDGPWKGAISLGLFRQEELAVALQKSIAARGVRGVRVAPRGPSPGRITLRIRPVGDSVIAELARLRTEIPDALARPCTGRG